MKSASIADFLELVRRDAAVQERVAEAARQKDPLQAVVKIASDAGFEIRPQELEAVLERELSEQELAAASGGVGSPAAAGFSPSEWFAEQYASVLLRKG
jgi:predicted ribosomally synthesized peptide with nif11-like leader